MFDVLDVQTPKLPLSASFELRGSNLDKDASLFASGILLGRVTTARTAYSHIAWIDDDEMRGGWQILIAADAANAAAENDNSWQCFLRAFEDLLRTCNAWKCIAESDCDQHRINKVATIEDLLAALDDERDSRRGALSVSLEISSNS